MSQPPRAPSQIVVWTADLDRCAAAWVCGNDPKLRAGLERHPIVYVLATSRSMRISIGRARIPAEVG